jgi:hypothetical protein
MVRGVSTAVWAVAPGENNASEKMKRRGMGLNFIAMVFTSRRFLVAFHQVVGAEVQKIFARVR